MHFLSRTGLFLLKAIAPAVVMGALNPGAVFYSPLFAGLWLFFHELLYIIVLR